MSNFSKALLMIGTLMLLWGVTDLIVRFAVISNPDYAAQIASGEVTLRQVPEEERTDEVYRAWVAQNFRNALDVPDGVVWIESQDALVPVLCGEDWLIVQSYFEERDNRVKKYGYAHFSNGHTWKLIDCHPAVLIYIPSESYFWKGDDLDRWLARLLEDSSYWWLHVVRSAPARVQWEVSDRDWVRAIIENHRIALGPGGFVPERIVRDLFSEEGFVALFVEQNGILNLPDDVLLSRAVCEAHRGFLEEHEWAREHEATMRRAAECANFS